VRICGTKLLFIHRPNHKSMYCCLMKREKNFTFYIIKYMLCRWTFIVHTAEIICEKLSLRTLVNLNKCPSTFMY
jgi:hypothetical protein